MSLPLIPAGFLRILKGSLAKMAGEKVIPPHYVNLKFWEKIPRKFNSKNKVMVFFVFVFFLNKKKQTN